MLPTKHIKTTAALTLAVSAIGAPNALARFDLNPPTVTHAQAGHRDVEVVRPNPDQQASQGSLQGVTPILPAPQPSQRAAFRKAQEQERLAYLADHQSNSANYSNAETNAYASAIPTSVPTPVVHVASHDGGFDWGDAGIGAAGGFALSMLAIGGALAISQRRTHRPLAS